jgi:hypothetical protein
MLKILELCYVVVLWQDSNVIISMKHFSLAELAVQVIYFPITDKSITDRIERVVVSVVTSKRRYLFWIYRLYHYICAGEILYFGLIFNLCASSKDVNFTHFQNVFGRRCICVVECDLMQMLK